MDLEQAARFNDLMEVIDLDELRGWDKDFITDLREKDEEGDVYLTGKMWVQLQRIADKFQ